MLRVAVLSLLLGALALVVGLTQFFAPPPVDDQQIAPVLWQASSDNVERGTGILNNGELQLELNHSGLGQVSLRSGQIQAQAYPFLHLALDGASKDLKVAITWNSEDTKPHNNLYWLESKSRAALWLATGELRGWTGKISALGLIFVGQAGETVIIRDFSIFTDSPPRQLRSIFSDLTSYAPWNREAMNSLSGALDVSSFYPVPLFVSYLLLSLLAYAVMLALLRKTMQFNPRVPALIFLACWIGLDLFWQNRLLHQLHDTYQTFSGKDTEEKLSAGPDGRLYDFASRVKPLLTADARVFVHSSDLYRGQRGAYFFYPLNVYWRQPWHLFPRYDQFRGGDYVVLIKPTTSEYLYGENRLPAPYTNPPGAETIFSDSTGKVLQLK